MLSRIPTRFDSPTTALHNFRFVGHAHPNPEIRELSPRKTWMSAWRFRGNRDWPFERLAVVVIAIPRPKIETWGTLVFRLIEIRAMWATRPSFQFQIGKTSPPLPVCEPTEQRRGIMSHRRNRPPDSWSQASPELSSAFPRGRERALWHLALWHLERHVARERPAGRYHLDFTGGGARGHGGRD